jgi:hypothetical protein
MEPFYDTLKANGYQKIPFKISRTQHLLLKASINGVKGDFILDTGASNSCVGFESIATFGLKAKTSLKKAAGAGAVGMHTQISEGNLLQINRWKDANFTLVIFDLSHVNMALQEYKVKPIHGIIGADILLQGQAIIDYYHHHLYLKKL